MLSIPLGGIPHLLPAWPAWVAFAVQRWPFPLFLEVAAHGARPAPAPRA